MKKLLSFGPLFVIAAALLWSLDGILRAGLYTLPPTVVVFYEHLLGSIILLFLFPLWIKDLKKLSKKEWLAIGAVALFSGALGTIFYTAALGKVQYTSYSVVVLLQQQLQPIWAVLAAMVLLKEKVTKKFFLWALLALVAAYFVTFKDGTVNLATGSGTMTAAAFALGAGLLWGSSTAISKFALQKVSFLTITTLRFFLAPIFAFLFILSMGQTDVLTTLTADQWKSLLFITLSTGLVALGIYYYGLKKTKARIATFCELVWPASAVLIDYFYFHKTLAITQVLGIAVLLFAIYQIVKTQKEK